MLIKLFNGKYIYICEEYVMISEHKYNYVINNYNKDIKLFRSKQLNIPYFFNVHLLMFI